MDEDSVIKCPHDAPWWQQGRVQLGRTTPNWFVFPVYWSLEGVTGIWGWPNPPSDPANSRERAQHRCSQTKVPGLERDMGQVQVMLLLKGPDPSFFRASREGQPSANPSDTPRGHPCMTCYPTGPAERHKDAQGSGASL